MKLTRLLELFAQTRILVIGDMMLDHYIWGDVHRISPEAPVPVMSAVRDTYTAGGAANVALNLSNLGVKTTLLGYYNNDEAGRCLTDILSENNINLLRVEQPNNAPTIVKTRVIARGQQLCRIDREVARELYCIDKNDEIDNLLFEAMQYADAVIISDYAKGVITQSLIDKVMSIAKSFPDLLLAVDPKPAHKLVFEYPGLLTPNRDEALALAGIAEPHLGERFPIELVCQQINQLYKPKLLVVTLGSEGMVISQHGEVLAHLPTEAKQAFDVSGAGDTVIATLCAALTCGETAVNATRLANAAAGCVIAHVGTAPIFLDELIEWHEKHHCTSDILPTHQ